MIFDIHFEWRYFALYFSVDDDEDYFYCSKNDYHNFRVYRVYMGLNINNDDWLIGDYCRLGFHFSNVTEELNIFCWWQNYDFYLPFNFFEQKAKEYVDHFNWIKEAYVP